MVNRVHETCMRAQHKREKATSASCFVTLQVLFWYCTPTWDSHTHVTSRRLTVKNVAKMDCANVEMFTRFAFLYTGYLSAGISVFCQSIMLVMKMDLIAFLLMKFQFCLFHDSLMSCGLWIYLLLVCYGVESLTVTV